MSVRYVEREPQQPLGAFVRRIWCLESLPGAPPPPPDRVLPDGCPEIVVHFGGDFGVATDGTPRTQPRTVVAGQLLSALELRPAGPVGLLGVRFHPGACGAFLGAAMRDLTDTTAPLADVAAALCRDLEDAVCSARDAEGRIAAAARVLSPIARCCRPDLRVAEAVRAIEAERGSLRIADLADHVGATSRTLERRFLDDAGIAPKTLARIVRFRRAAQMLRSPAACAAAVAAACGYADQPHLTREFGEFAGESPGRWFRRTHAFGDPFLGA